MKYKILALALAASVELAMAQGMPDSIGSGTITRVLTLEECRQMAVDNNAKVKIAAANAQAAEETRKEAFTKYFPEITAQAIGFHANKAAFQYDVLNMFSLELLHKGWGANVTAIQPVFAGGRIAYGNSLAKVGVEASKLQEQDAINDVRLTSEQYYWQIVTLKSKKNTLQSVINMLDTLYNQVNVAVNAGVVNRNELLKVQLKRNDMLATMVDLDNGIALSCNLLAQYVGLDGTPITVDGYFTPEDMPEFPFDIYVSPEEALYGTVDYQLLDAQARAARIEQRITLGENLPTVGIGGGYFYDDLLNEKHGFAAGFISVSVPISGWWGGSHAMKRSKLKTANALEEKEDLSQMLKIQMQDTWDNLTAAYRKMTIAKESIAQAKENLRISRNFYDAGVSTVTDLLDAQTLYRQACDQYIEAYGNFCMCKANYLNSIGRLDPVQ